MILSNEAELNMVPRTFQVLHDSLVHGVPLPRIFCPPFFVCQTPFLLHIQFNYYILMNTFLAL